VIDSHLPRFSQGVQAVLLALAFLLNQAWIVVLLGALLVLAAVGGPKLNGFAYAYRSLPIPRGEPEAAAPPRFAQTIGAVFLTISSVGLLSLAPQSTAWWVLGWGPALIVMVLSGLAATTSF
jgi:uncharacterized protein DUF4395